VTAQQGSSSSIERLHIMITTSTPIAPELPYSLERCIGCRRRESVTPQIGPLGESYLCSPCLDLSRSRTAPWSHRSPGEWRASTAEQLADRAEMAYLLTVKTDEELLEFLLED